MTNALALATGGAFLVGMSLGAEKALAPLAGFVPARVGGLVVPGALPLALTPLTATFLHGGLLHLGFNLLMLVYCGRQVETPIGAWPLLVLYVLGAYCAAAAQYGVDPASPIPMIGASGAISALVGAYAILYGQRRTTSLHPELARWLHALWLAVAWLGLQLLLGVASNSAGTAVATAAHVGGFMAGLILARHLLRWRYRKA